MKDRAIAPAGDTKRDLLEAARTAVQTESEKAGELRARRLRQTQSRIGTGILALIGVVGLLILLGRPAWLTGPDRPPPEPPAIAAVSARLTLLRERQHVLDFLRTTGRLPKTLAEAGSTVPGVRYRPTSDRTFDLILSAGDSVMTLGSNEGVSAFLGAGLRTLRTRGKR
jgi:hypothetical protein